MEFNELMNAFAAKCGLAGVEAGACRRVSGIYRMFFHKGEEKSNPDCCLYSVTVFISCYGRYKWKGESFDKPTGGTGI